MLNILAKEKCNILVVGDFNIHLVEVSNTVRGFLSVLQSYCLRPIVKDNTSVGT